MQTHFDFYYLCLTNSRGQYGISHGLTFEFITWHDR